MSNLRSTALQISTSELLHMREIDGLSNKEIASRLGISIGTVYNRIGGKTARRTSDSKPSVHRLIPGPNHSTENESPISNEPQTEPRQLHPLVKLKPGIEQEFFARRMEEQQSAIQNGGVVITADRRVIDVKGQYHSYTIDTGTKKIMVDGDASYTQEDLGWFIRELMQVHGILRKELA